MENGSQTGNGGKRFCVKCGAEINPNAKFCVNCGNPSEAVTNDQSENSTTPYVSMTNGSFVQGTIQPAVYVPEKNKGIMKRLIPIMIAVVAIIVALVVALILLFGDSDSEYIDFVKEGHPNSYPNSTYGEAFDDFFSEPSWKYFVSSEDKDIVEFSGGCEYRDAEVVATIQFVLDYENGTFEAGYFDMNGVPQNELMTSAIITTVFDDYETGSSSNSLDGIEETTDLDAETEDEYANLDSFVECINSYSDSPDLEETELQRYYKEQYDIWKNGEGYFDVYQNSDGSFYYQGNDLDASDATYTAEYWADSFARSTGPAAGLSIWSVDENGILFAYGIGGSGYLALVDLRDCQAYWTDENQNEAVFQVDENYQIDLSLLEDGSIWIIESGVSPYDVSLAGFYYKDSLVDAYTSQYVFPESDSLYLEVYDCDGLTATECKIARNEIYARHGRMFSDEVLQNYFDCCTWYAGTISPEDFSDDMLSEVEKANLQTISTYETNMGYK